jgi:hypothetical protein
LTDNLLTGSGTSAADLWIFEIGPDIEGTLVDLSKDGLNWFKVGAIGGSTYGIDLDEFGFGVDDHFSYVRLTDSAGDGATSGATVGADIDAIGAISTIPNTAVPEPTSWAMMIGGFAAIGMGLRRRQRTQLSFG